MDPAPSATAGPPGLPRGSNGPTGNDRRSGSETRSPRTTTAKMDAAPSATAGPPGNPRGSETRSLRTTSVHGVKLGNGASTATMPGGILGRGTDGPTGNGRRSGSETRSLRTASVHGVTLGGGTSISRGNPRGSEGPSRKGTPARGSIWEEPRLPSSSFPLEQISASSPLRLQFSSNWSLFRHITALTPFSRPSAEWASHFCHRPPASASLPDTFVDPMRATEGPGPSPYTIHKKMKGK